MVRLYLSLFKVKGNLGDMRIQNVQKQKNPWNIFHTYNVLTSVRET